MANKVVKTTGKFLSENKQEVIQLIGMKIQLINSILEYKTRKKEIEVQSKALDVKKLEIESNSVIELERIKSDAEKSKKEYETVLKQREFEHNEKMKKLEMIQEQLREGNEFIKEIIKDNKMDIIKNHKSIIQDFATFQLEIAKLLKEL